ncbi:uncharacterized protein LOC126836587 [Adelges cooleyi]|uniref:uncharacterized protein LOC126836587 n=1 Tax=Adelges cooleyi TaxID=133065 RepID=UPI0021803D14|nr:uncharacterized protein LOC126836587 [Adelges cooleyi]
MTSTKITTAILLAICLFLCLATTSLARYIPSPELQKEDSLAEILPSVVNELAKNQFMKDANSKLMFYAKVWEDYSSNIMRKKLNEFERDKHSKTKAQLLKEINVTKEDAAKKLFEMIRREDVELGKLLDELLMKIGERNIVFEDIATYYLKNSIDDENMYYM